MKRKAITVLGVLAASLAMTACNNNVRKDSCNLDCASCSEKECCGSCGGDAKSCCGTCGGDKKECCGECGGEGMSECCGECGGEGHKHNHGDHSHD